MELDLTGRLEQSLPSVDPPTANHSPAAAVGLELSLGRSSGETGPAKPKAEEGLVPFGLQVMPVILQCPNGYCYARLLPCWVPTSVDLGANSVYEMGGDRKSAVEMDGVVSGVCQMDVAGGFSSPESTSSETSVLQSFSAKGESSSTNESRSHSNSATTDDSSAVSALRSSKPGLGKPPTHTKRRKKPALSQKCRALVSTRSVEGKKIDGHLYQCSKSEVKIICSCHGSFFSPAGFVRHAGGPETCHPLRQITVVPS